MIGTGIALTAITAGIAVPASEALFDAAKGAKALGQIGALGGAAITIGYLGALALER